MPIVRLSFSGLQLLKRFGRCLHQLLLILRQAAQDEPKTRLEMQGRQDQFIAA